MRSIVKYVRPTLAIIMLVGDVTLFIVFAWFPSYLILKILATYVSISLLVIVYLVITAEL